VDRPDSSGVRLHIEAKRIAVIGSAIGGGAAQVIDALVGTDVQATGVFDNDDRARGKDVLGVPVLGDSSLPTIAQAHAQGRFDAAVIAIGGDLRERERIFRALQQAGIPTTNVVDPTVQIRSGATIGTGNVLLGGVYLGPHATIGDNCYIINGTTIQHETIVGDHSYFSAGCGLAGRIRVGQRVRFDTGSGAKANLSVGDDAVVGAGLVLIADLAAGHRASPPAYLLTPIA